MEPISKKIVLWVVTLIFIFLLIFLYKTYNPSEVAFFPKCPFKLITGLLCPGCGSQRAAHHLLNFKILDAIQENSLLMLTLPYGILHLFFTTIKNPNEIVLRWRKRLYSKKAIWIIIFIIIVYWIGKNVYNYRD